MRIEVIHAAWGAGDAVYEGGQHDVPSPTDEFLKLLAGGESVGAVRVLKATQAERRQLDKATQTQEHGEREYDKAQKSGAWHEGNLAQHEVEQTKTKRGRRRG